MMKFRLIFPALVAAALALFPITAGAVVLSVVPQQDTVRVGDTISIDIVVSGLEPENEAALRAYDFDLLFNPYLFSFRSVDFGNTLASVGPDGFRLSSARWLGRVAVIEATSEDAVRLNALQPSSFTLATITLLARAEGATELFLQIYAIFDAHWRDLEVETVTAALRIHARNYGRQGDANMETPLPGALWLWLAGAGGLAAIRRRGAGGSSSV